MADKLIYILGWDSILLKLTMKYFGLYL